MLRDKALKLGKKPIDNNKYTRINEKINVEVSGLTLKPVNTANDARKEMKRVLPSYISKTKNQTREQRYKTAKIRVGVLDSEGFGLKEFREKRKYKKLLNMLTKLRNYVTDDNLNKMIREHVDESETTNTMLLDIERAKRLTANESDNIYAINDFVSSEIIAALENFNQEYRERLIEKRKAIGKRIEVIESRKNNVVHKSKRNTSKKR